MTLIPHRHTAYNLLPDWARGLNLFRLIYVMQLILDEMGTAMLAAAKLRFPGYYSHEGDARIGAERKFWQGPNESADSFVERMRPWWENGQYFGHFHTMCKHVQAYCLPATFNVSIVQNNGVRHSLSHTGTWDTDTVDWDWDGDANKWSRFWVLLSNTALGVSGTDATVLASRSVRQAERDVGSVTPFLNETTSPIPDHREIRRIMEEYRTPHTQCAGIVLLLDEESFWLAPPDGTWTYWANRNPAALYWAGTPLS
jgi:hypothetical protein